MHRHMRRPDAQSSAIELMAVVLASLTSAGEYAAHAAPLLSFLSVDMQRESVTSPAVRG